VTGSISDITVDSSYFNFPKSMSVYHGKVRDVYDFGDRVAMVVSDRISAFDHILPRAIPFKGQVLNQIAGHFLKATSDIVPNWLLDIPDPNVSIGLKCTPIKLEMVVRGYLAGHAWREYKSGKRTLCGVSMPDGMQEADRFAHPIITPATKAEEGHDEDISKADILAQGIVTSKVYEQLEKYSISLFQRGSEMAKDRGLILVDTKYEFGMHDDKVYLIDEIHTPDSSRYYILEGYDERQRDGTKQKQLSKEFVREWLMEHGFQGKDDQIMPEMPTSFVWMVSQRYIELYEQLTGSVFEKVMDENINQRIQSSVNQYFK